MIINAHIPLITSPTRQKLWRVMMLWSVIGAGIIIGFFTTSLVLKGFLHPPSHVQWSLSFRNTSANAAFLHTYTKGISPLPGLPWDVPTLLQKTHAQTMSIFVENNTLALTLYRPEHLEELRKEAESFGFMVTNNEHLTIISLTAPEISSTTIKIPPFFGIALLQNGKNTLTIQDKRAALSFAFPTDAYQPEHLSLPIHDPLVALRLLPGASLSPYFSIHDQATLLFADLLETYGGEGAVWKKEEKFFYSFWVPTVLDTNVIHILSHAGAQAYAQTITRERSDGKIYRETRLTKPLTLTSNHTNDITSTIVTTANNEFVMRITQTPTSTLITNAPLEAGETFTPSAQLHLQTILNQYSTTQIRPTNTILLLRKMNTITFEKHHVTLIL